MNQNTRYQACAQCGLPLFNQPDWRFIDHGGLGRCPRCGHEGHFAALSEEEQGARWRQYVEEQKANGDRQP